MAEMSKEEKQALVDSGAPKLWALEILIRATGDKAMITLAEQLHGMAEKWRVAEGLTLPPMPKSGGGGK